MIGIVFCNDLNMCPYIEKYLAVFDDKKTDYEIIIWNRTGEDRDFPSNYRVYNEKSAIHTSKSKKLGGYYRYGQFLNRVIRERRYDKLVMLTTLPAVLCYRTLVKKYAKKYIFDFRDLGLEKNKLFRKIVANICKASYFTCISSPEFAEILGRSNMVIAHNFRYKDVKRRIETATELGEQINLLHIGITRGEDYNKRLADLFGNDKRFRVLIVGSGNDTKTFVEYTKQYTNIDVIGRYTNEEKEKYIKNADMLLYYYPCDFNCNRALANKYYDGLIYKKPLVGNINTYSGKRVQEKEIGVALDLSDDEFANKVYAYISNLNHDDYMLAAREELDRVLAEDRIYLECIENFAMDLPIESSAYISVIKSK